MPIYKTFYWKNIQPKINSYFIGSTSLINENGNNTGLLQLVTRSDTSTDGFTIDEEFSFILDNGSMNFTIGYNSNTFSAITNGNYGTVSNKSGIYTDINSIKYYFSYDNTKKLWKITFAFI